MNTPAAPGATYRLQFNAEFTFADARDVVAYLHMLPISRPTPPLSSPRAGSPHGYDIVPNHMGVGGDDNAWWLDVLENGEASTYATYFDIDWHPVNPALRNKVLLPFLADHYGTVLEHGELQLVFAPESGTFGIRYYEHLFPLDPRTYPQILAVGLAARTASRARRGMQTAAGRTVSSTA